MRNHHLFEIINTNFKIQIIQNEKYSFSLHRRGLVSRTPRTNWPKLPVSTIRSWWGVTDNGQSMIPSYILAFKLLADRKAIIWTYFYSDYDLNTVCNDICIEKTLKCITTCDSTDSECIYGCMRAEITCLESKFCNINIISYPTIYRKRLYKKFSADNSYMCRPYLTISLRLPLQHRLS